MPFTVQQTIIPPPPVPPTSWWKAPLILVLLPIALPILIIGIGVLLALIIGYGGWQAGRKIILPIRKLFGYQPPPEPLPVPEVPAVLFRNEQLRLLTTEPQWDAVSPDFEQWIDEAWDDGFPGLYSLQTVPEIPGLHGQLVSDLCREWSDGLFLQLVQPLPDQMPPATTWLIYLELATLCWHRVVETNDYYLLPDAAELEHGAFEGRNPAGKRLELVVQTDA